MRKMEKPIKVRVTKNGLHIYINESRLNCDYSALTTVDGNLYLQITTSDFQVENKKKVEESPPEENIMRLGWE